MLFSILIFDFIYVASCVCVRACVCTRARVWVRECALRVCVCSSMFGSLTPVCGREIAQLCGHREVRGRAIENQMSAGTQGVVAIMAIAGHSLLRADNR